ncbi:MAG: GNAT family N-acetyltransferase [Defluviitaleaceae bacterium]|nr:GNAT family N-acetyltransferase [Defluviitaleaceae bacterium]
MKEIALEYLERNRVLYMAMIFPIKRGTVNIIYAGQDGAFIKDMESGVSMIAIDNLDKGKELLDGVLKPVHICVYRKDIAEYLYEKYGYRKYVENVQAVYMNKSYVEVKSQNLKIELLTLANLDWVYENYCDQLDYSYLKSRIENGAIYGGRLEGELCGFIGVHADGSIGILKVLEKFRGLGLALELEGNMINTLLKRGDIPFSQIEFDNEASIGLHKKLGFEISKDTLYRLID